MIGTTQGLGVARHALRTTILPLGHEVRSCQHGDVLLHSGERHVVARGQFADRRVSTHDSRQDVASRGICQRMEQLIQDIGRRESIYNHLVVDSITAGARDSETDYKARYDQGVRVFFDIGPASAATGPRITAEERKAVGR